MATSPDTITGAITLTSGSAAFTTSGTNMLTRGHLPGDTIFRNGFVLIIATITGENSGTLLDVCPAGAAGTAVPVRIRFQPDGSRVAAQARNLIDILGNGNLQAEAGLTGAADKISYFTGAGTKTLTTLTAKARSLIALNDEAAMRALIGIREPLLATLNLYVNATTGNNSNPGTIALPFLTINAALAAALVIDFRRAKVVINVADGNYPEIVNMYGGFLWASQSFAAPIEFVGNVAAPANVVVQGFAARYGAFFKVSGFKTVCATANVSAIAATGFGSRIEVTNHDFGQMSSTGDHLSSSQGGQWVISGNYTISGGGQNHFHVTENSDGRANGATANIPNNITFTGNFAGVAGCEFIAIGWTFTGAGVVTCARFLVHYKGTIRTSLDSKFFFPGTVHGTMQSGGMFDLGVLGRMDLGGTHYSLAPGSMTQIPLTNIALNIGSTMTTGSSGTCFPYGGPINLRAKITLNAGKTTGQLFGVAIYKNGAVFDECYGEQGAAATPQTLEFSVDDTAAPTDYYQMYARADGTGNKQVNGNPRWTSFAVSQRG